MSFECRQRQSGFEKKNKKAKKAIDRKDDVLILCLLTMNNKKENTKKKIRFVEDFKKPMEIGMICTIDGDTLFFVHKEHVDQRLLCIVSHH